MAPLAIVDFTWSDLAGWPAWKAFVGILIVAGILINFIAVYAGLNTYLERKIAGHMQARVGPYQVGPHGFLQWLADALKLMFKEDIIPKDVDRFLFRLAPYVVMGGAFATWVALPYTRGWSPAKMDIGILYIMAVSSAGVLGLLMAGWSSGSKWSLFGAMRAAAQIVSYEVPVGITVLGMLLIFGTLDLQSIAEQQLRGGPWGFAPEWQVSWAPILHWGLWRQPPFTIIAFIVLYIGALAETNRTPFDIPEAESELVAGYHTEYSGMRFSFFFLAEYANMFVVSAIITTLFLGGWAPIAGPMPGGLLGFLYGIFWFLGKSFFLVLIMMFLRWTLPRYRVDQLMDLCWKKLTPLSFVNLFAIGVGEWNRWAGAALGVVVLGIVGALLAKEIFAAPAVETPRYRTSE